ncbi:hypothetical protein [Streptomyces cinereospinus]|uniref:Cupin domain-containing protein n=1 Tax=Streptomyces cinereospinus TaxID=285561 RepID=A0ABV5N7A1_9ACTN
MPFAADDARTALASPPRADTDSRAPRRAQLLNWRERSHDDAGTGPSRDRSQYARGQNFTVVHTELTGGEAVGESGVPDEHMVLLPHAGVRLTVSTAAGDVVLDEPGLVIVPAGTSSVSADRDCAVLRVFTCRAEYVAGRAENADRYAVADPAVAPLPSVPPIRIDGAARVYRLADVPADPKRLGRIFRTDSLMINWFPRQEGPRDPEKLSPHVHDDFEQGSVTLTGDFVHHFRYPWTPRLSEWRDDEAAPCSGLAVAVIPPGVIHTTRAVGDGAHDLIDVFAPPRADFLAAGWVLNARDYHDPAASADTSEPGVPA